jgi:Glyoxalase superfamily protein
MKWLRCNTRWRASAEVLIAVLFDSEQRAVSTSLHGSKPAGNDILMAEPAVVRRRRFSHPKQQGRQVMTAASFEIRSSIPVLRMLDEAKARAFYLDYLGFDVDWESRFNPTAPLYMQIHLGEAVIHLNGHAPEVAPISRVNIPVVGLDNYCQYLIAKGAGYPKPCVVDPRFLGRNTDMNIEDPFGNELVFCSQRTEG